MHTIYFRTILMKHHQFEEVRLSMFLAMYYLALGSCINDGVGELGGMSCPQTTQSPIHI